MAKLVLYKQVVCPPKQKLELDKIFTTGHSTAFVHRTRFHGDGVEALLGLFGDHIQVLFGYSKYILLLLAKGSLHGWRKVSIQAQNARLPQKQSNAP